MNIPIYKTKNAGKERVKVLAAFCRFPRPTPHVQRGGHSTCVLRPNWLLSVKPRRAQAPKPGLAAGKGTGVPYQGNLPAAWREFQVLSLQEVARPSPGEEGITELDVQSSLCPAELKSQMSCVTSQDDRQRNCGPTEKGGRQRDHILKRSWSKTWLD